MNKARSHDTQVKGNPAPRNAQNRALPRIGTLGLPLFWALATALSAATYHVDQASQTASDSNPGTQEAPFLTISAGVARLKAGDTLIIHPGVYRETVRIKTSGEEGKPIIVEAQTKGTVTIRGAAVVTDWRPSDENPNIYVHEGWQPYFGKWDPSLVKGGDQFKAKFGGKGGKTMAYNQVFVNGVLIREVACPQKREPGTFYIDKAKKQIHLWLENGADPSQFTVEATDRDVLFEASKASYLQVKGLNFEHCANAIQQAAVNFTGGANNLIEDCAIINTAMVGLGMAGENHIVRRCGMNHNGQQGFKAPSSENVRIEDSETCYNNCIPWKRVNVGFQAGGFKVAVSHKMKFLRHKAIGNYGPGLWFDISNDETEVSNCFAAKNDMFGGVMNEISFRIHVHDSVFIDNSGAGVLIAESPGALIERNLIVGNETGIGFRDMPRSTASVTIRNGRSEKGEKAPVWNHDEVARNNVLAFNRSAQVNFGVDEINANRQIPQRLLGRLKQGKKGAQDVETKMAEEYVDKKYGLAQAKGVYLEKLNFSIDGNIYWSGGAGPLHQWKGLLTYTDLKGLSSTEGFEKNGSVCDPQFANWQKYDLRVPEGSPLIAKGCYPRGDVPGVKLGVIAKDGKHE